MRKQGLVTAMLVSLIGLGGLQGCATTQETAQEDKRKLIIQVSDGDPAKWNLALNNARNVQQELGKDKVQVEIVTYGPGIGMLKANSKVAPRLAQAMDNNVTLSVCENTMKNTKTPKAAMYNGVSYVNAGVIHIMQRQREGWSYLRP